MRKAFTLVEMIAVIAALPLIMVVISGVYATLLRDIPRSVRVLQENTTVLDLLQQIRRDMDEAVGLPEQFEGRLAGERTLLIAQRSGVISYQLEDEQVVRTQVAGPSEATPSESQSQESVWKMRDAVVVWKPWVQDGKPYAVEIHSHVKQLIAGLLQKKLPSSHVFFIGGLAPEGEIQ